MGEAMRWLALFLVVAFLPAQAQVWCPPGAEWTFNYVDVLGGWHGVARVEYAGDTLLDGHQAQRLRQWTHIAPPGTQDYTSWGGGEMYTYHSDDVVYEWTGWPEHFDTLFWFGAAPGDHWRSVDGSDLKMIVTDTATVTIDAVPLRRLVVQTDPDMWFLTDTLYERMGFDFLYLAGYSWFLLDMPIAGLRCYRDNDLSYTALGVNDCGFTLSVNDGMDLATLVPFPNPGTDDFTLQLPGGMHTIEVFDATGRRVLRQRTVDKQLRIDTEALTSGTYAVLVSDASGMVRRSLWVKG